MKESKQKDWVGNNNSVYTTLGASSHSKHEREQNDYYATDPIALEKLLEFEEFNSNIWEPACGEGHLSKLLIKRGYNVRQSDIINRIDNEKLDFLSITESNFFDGDIVTNPPYKFAKEFVEKSLDIVKHGNKVVMFLKIQFLEGKARKKLFEKYPPKTIYVSSSRITCAKSGNFHTVGSGAMAYAWFIWEKGYHGHPIIKWFN